jgi:hypothetical protein
MNRFHIVVTTLVAAVALGFTLRTLGEHEAVGASAALATDPTPFTEESEHIPRDSSPAEPPSTF